MKQSGEKMYSYVHFEKELIPAYHREIKSKKNISEVKDVFIGTCFKLLERLDIGILQKDMERIIFTPEREIKWEFKDTLKEKTADAFSNSDLNAIISRLADEAFKWHEHIANRDEEREFVNSRNG